MNLAKLKNAIPIKLSYVPNIFLYIIEIIAIYIFADNSTDDMFIVITGDKFHAKWKINIIAVLAITGAIINIGNLTLLILKIIIYNNKLKKSSEIIDSTSII